MTEINTTQPPEAASLISRAVQLDREIKERKKDLEAVKARLQTLALAEMDNKNLRYLRYTSLAGQCETTYKTKLEVDNYSRLVAALDGAIILEDKIARKMEVKYDIDKRFKEALIALCRKDYAVHDIPAILAGMGITDEKTQSYVLKKLKGEYAKDKALLESVGCTGHLEEELDAIHEEKNRQLIERFFDEDLIDIDEIRKAVYLEDSLSMTLTSPEKGGEEDAEGKEE